MLNERDRDILEHIIKYCNETELTIKMFDDSLETLKINVVYKNAVSMCILQIGELTTYLSKNFLEEHTKIPWSRIKKMRNIAAHNYGKFDINVLHCTIISDIPELKAYCIETLNEES
jgi:uncharacterized protein with HEPN domain